jgi:hypothetical protein
VSDVSSETGDWICLDWYDGPLTEIAVVTFADGDKRVQMRTFGGWVGEESRIGANGESFSMSHMRFSRDELAAMLDLIDGKAVRDFFDEPEGVAITPPAPAATP